MQYRFEDYNLKVIVKEQNDGRVCHVAKLKEYPEIEGVGWTQSAAIDDLRIKFALHLEKGGKEIPPMRVRDGKLTPQEALTNLVYNATVILDGQEYSKQDFINIIQENLW